MNSIMDINNKFNKQKIQNIINKLDINYIKKHYIFENINDNNEHNLSKNWDLFFKKIKEYYKEKDYIYLYIINIITNTLKNNFNIERNYINKLWYIRINNFCKNIYLHFQNIRIFQNKHKVIKSILKIILKEIFLNLETKKLSLETFNKRYKDTWCIILSENDINFFKKDCSFNDYVYFNELPQNWEYINNEIHLNFKNDILFKKKNITTFPQYLEDIHIKNVYNTKMIEYINTLQKIQYKIDLELFLNSFSNIKNLIKFYLKKDNSIIIKDYDKYILNNINEYSNDFYNDEEKVLKRFYNLEFKENSTQDDFDLNENEKIVLKFIYNYNNELLANNLYMDYRGRLYTLGPISYISSKLFRFLIDLDENLTINKTNIYYKYYVACQISNPINLEDGIKIYENINFNNNNVINNLNFDKLELFNGKTISLDATSSMLQVIGLLTNNTKLLKYTNLTSSDIKYDIYKYIEEILLNNNNYKTIFKDYFTSRKIYKYCIMLYIYGSTALYSAKSYIKINNIKNIHIKDLTYIFNEIINTFKKEFKCIVILKKIIQLYAELIKYEKYYKFNTLLKKLEYSCPDEQEIKLNFDNKYVYFYIENYKESYEKKMKSSFVNIIHSLDSEIAILTRIKLLEKYNIKSLSIHDCFIVHINNYEKCLECYNESLEEILNLDINYIINDIYNDNDFIKIWNKKYKEYIFNNDSFLKNFLKKNKIEIDKNLNFDTFLKDLFESKKEKKKKEEDVYFKIRTNKDIVLKLENYIEKYIKNNYINYNKNYKLLKDLSDFNKDLFDKKNIKYSLKPE